MKVKDFTEESLKKKGYKRVLNDYHFTDDSGGGTSRDQLTRCPACRATNRGQPF